MAATTSKRRLRKLITWAGLILGIGLAYALFCLWTGFSIPCPIRTTTGLLCPGCGVTRMCLALLQLDFIGAWDANPGLVLLLPVLALFLGRLGWRYVKTGGTRLTKGENVLVWCMVGVMLVYGVLRNMGGPF